MKYPNALGPAFRVYGRVLKAYWPMLFALTAAYPLVNWGASLAWKALPVATGWVEIGLEGLQTLAWAIAWGLMGAVLAQLTLATTDRRPADPGALLRACASALPVIALFVLATDVTSLPLSLWRTHVAASGQVQQADLMGALSLPFAIFDLVVLWLFFMAVPIRLDRELSLLETLKVSARLARKRWKSVLLVFLLSTVAFAILGVVMIVALSATGGPADSGRPPWMTDNYLWKAPIQVLSMAWMLFWPALYVTFRDQEGSGAVEAAFD